MVVVIIRRGGDEGRGIAVMAGWYWWRSRASRCRRHHAAVAVGVGAARPRPFLRPLELLLLDCGWIAKTATYISCFLDVSLTESSA